MNKSEKNTHEKVELKTLETREKFLGVKRREDQTSGGGDFFPLNFRKEENLKTDPFPCITEALKCMNWGKFNKRFEVAMLKPLQENKKLPKISANASTIIFQFFGMDELLELFKVNSSFKKIILLTRKWFGFYFLFVNLLNTFPCKMKHRRSFNCIASPDNAKICQKLFSNNFLRETLKNFDFIEGVTFLSNEEQGTLVGEFLCRLYLNSKNLQIDDFDWAEKNLFYLQGILNSAKCKFNSVSLRSNNIQEFNIESHKFNFLTHSRFKYFSFTNFPITGNLNFEILNLIISKNNFLQKILFSFNTFEHVLGKDEELMLCNNLRIIFSHFLKVEKITHFIFENESFFISTTKLKKEQENLISLDSLKKLSGIFKISNDASNFNEIFLNELYQILNKNGLRIDIVKIFLKKGKFLKISDRSFKMISLNLSELKSLKLDGPLDLTNYKLLRKIRLLENLENLELNQIMLNGEEFLQTLNYLSENPKIINFTAENLVISFDEIDKTEFESKWKNICKKINELRENKKYELTIPHFVNTRDNKHLIDNKTSFSEILINDFTKIILY